MENARIRSKILLLLIATLGLTYATPTPRRTAAEQFANSAGTTFRGLGNVAKGVEQACVGACNMVVDGAATCMQLFGTCLYAGGQVVTDIGRRRESSGDEDYEEDDESFEEFDHELVRWNSENEPDQKKIVVKNNVRDDDVTRVQKKVQFEEIVESTEPTPTLLPPILPPPTDATVEGPPTERITRSSTETSRVSSKQKGRNHSSTTRATPSPTPAPRVDAAVQTLPDESNTPSSKSLESTRTVERRPASRTPSQPLPRPEAPRAPVARDYIIRKKSTGFWDSKYEVAVKQQSSSTSNRKKSSSSKYRPVGVLKINSGWFNHGYEYAEGSYVLAHGTGRSFPWTSSFSFKDFDRRKHTATITKKSSFWTSSTSYTIDVDAKSSVRRRFMLTPKDGKYVLYKQSSTNSRTVQRVATLKREWSLFGTGQWHMTIEQHGVVPLHFISMVVAAAST